MKHLSPEELLLHCDGALAPDLAAHLQQCRECRESWLDHQLTLQEALEALRASVPPEPLANKAASRVSLELVLYPPQTGTGFPLKWPAVYATAAALTLTVLSGYFTNRQSMPSGDTRQMASTLSVPAESPAAASLRESHGTGSPVAATELEDGKGAAALPLVTSAAGYLAANNENDTQEPENLVPSSTELESPARFDLASLAPRPLPTERNTWASPPTVVIAASASDSVLAISPAVAVVGEFAQRELREPEQKGDFSPAPIGSMAKIVEGYWILTQAHVWEEDLRPVWKAGGLSIEGSVEDQITRDRVQAAIARQAPGSAVSFEIRLREKPAQETGTASAPPGVRVMKASYDAPAAGGPVRQALLGHFGDAARRSFITPRPAVLEGELVRFVSEILRHQSEFLSHVYAMRRFLNHVDPEQLAAADQPTAQRFRDVVKFHLRALDEREAAIYDGLSETLPRKFWTYRGDDRRSPETANWRDESTALLRDSLQFDSRLSALFGSTAVPVNMEDLDLSCGELLQRIRTHIRRIKSQTQAL